MTTDKDTNSDVALSNDLNTLLAPQLDAAETALKMGREKLKPLYEAYSDYTDELDTIDRDLEHLLGVIEEIRPELRIGDAQPAKVVEAEQLGAPYPDPDYDDEPDDESDDRRTGGVKPPVEEPALDPPDDDHLPDTHDFDAKAV